jgi:hypothetical protein
MDSVSTELSDDDKASKIVRIQSEELNKGSLISCHNCKRINTSLWRKDSGGNNLCNACGLFLNKNGYHKSIKQQSDDIFIEIDQKLMKFNKIKRRRRIRSKSLGKNSIEEGINMVDSIMPNATMFELLHPSPILGHRFVRETIPTSQLVQDKFYTISQPSLPPLPPVSALFHELYSSRDSI